MSPDILSIVIFAVCVVFFVWNKIPIATVALSGLVAMVLANVVSFGDGFKHFSGTIVMLIAGMMVVGQATFDTGLAQIVGDKVISLANHDERKIIILGTFITGLLSAFLSNVATLSIMISIITSVCAGNKEVKFKNVIMPISIAAVLGGTATLVGSTPQLTGNGILESFIGEGNGFSFFTFSPPGFLVLFILTIYVGFIGYPLGKKLWGNRDDYDRVPVLEEVDEINAEEFDNGKVKIMGFIFFLTVIAFILADFISEYIPNFSITMVALISALLCILTGCISHKNAIRSINWSLIIWFASCLGMAEGLASSGGGELLAGLFMRLFGENPSPYVLLVAFTLFVAFLTQFLSNSTVLTIFLPIIIPLTMELGLDPYPYTVAMTMAAGIAVATPLANSTIGMSMIADYKFSDYLYYGGPITIIALIIVLVMAPILWPIM